MRFDTLAVHCTEIDPSTRAVAPAIHLSTTYARDGSYELGPWHYVREGNPTQALFEDALSKIEGGAGALAFASGMAAGAAVIQSLEPGSHVVLPEDVYYGYRAAASEFLRGWGYRIDYASMDESGSLERAVRDDTRLVWLETPSNPMLKVTDLRAAVAVAESVGALTLADDTFATPALQRPIPLGVDMVLHATTKYIGGHSDVHGGALVFARRGEFFDRVLLARKNLGAIGSPFHAWLALRGLRTLGCRMDRHSRNAMSLATWLASHPRVRQVHYPGLPSHPGHEVARRQMVAFGGMLSFQLADGGQAAKSAATRTRLFVPATSLGGVESLIEHRHSVEGPDSKTPPDLLRLSVGLEDPEDLMEDLDKAL
jgi:cystathionine gamma-synthase